MSETSAMDGVRVSVIIPCYNLGRYLDDAVDSVLRQTFDDYEILVVDDGSTDSDTRRLLDDYERPRLKVIRSENRGLPGARNFGLAHTTGEYVCMLDADDLLEPACLERSVAALDADPSIAFVSHWLRTFGDEHWEWTPTRCDFPALLDVNTVNGAALVRRSALDAVGGFDETMRDGCEDWDLWITLVERGFSGRILPEVLFNYRRRPDSMSRLMSQADGHARLYRRLVQKHAETYKHHLVSLVIRREEDLSNLIRHTHDLDLEYGRWLAPELAKWRDDVAAIERKIARQPEAEMREAHARLNEERNRLREALDQSEAERRLSEENFAEERAGLRTEIDRHTVALEMARTRADQLDATLAQAREDREALARQFETARVRAFQLDAAANQAQREAQELRGSISWKITTPLRALYGGVRRIFTRGSR
jgi:glycosyltransferase involved in cell wall biosynthesis